MISLVRSTCVLPKIARSLDLRTDNPILRGPRRSLPVHTVHSVKHMDGILRGQMKSPHPNRMRGLSVCDR